MYELRSRVRYSEADATGKLTLVAFMNYLQDCATMQAEDLAIGLEYLGENHLGWFITSYEIEICGEFPKVGDAIVVKTWPYKFRGMFGYRDFLFEYEDGTTIARADSVWVLMNHEEMKPQRILPKMADAYEASVFDRLPGEWSERKKLTGTTEASQETFEVSKMVIDTNGHMNNAYYLQAAVAVLPQDFTFRRFYIQYKQSARYQDVVQVAVSELQNGKEVTLYKNAEEVYCVIEFLE